MASTHKPPTKRRRRPCYTVTQQTGCASKSTSDKSDPCYKHGRECKATYDEYHGICTRIWDQNCSDEKNYHENWKLSKEFETCGNLRYGFTQRCVAPDCRSRGHHAAVMKMRKRKGSCDLVLQEQGEGLQEGIREFVKEQKVREEELLSRFDEDLQRAERLMEEMRLRQEARQREEEMYKPAPPDLLVLPIPLEPEEVGTPETRRVTGAALDPGAQAFTPKAKRKP